MTETTHGLTVEEIPRVQTAEEAMAKQFKQDTAKHVMTVLLDDGVHRHLRFQIPQSSSYWFELITWPGSLAIRGDIDGFVFSRLTDMFEFFRGKGINAHYWAEKLEGGRDVAMSFSEELFNQQVTEALKEAEEDTPGVTAAWEKEVDGIFAEYDTSSEAGARAALEAFDYLPEGDKGEPFRFEDAWEWSFRDYDTWFLWACHAIVSGIAQYDAGRPATGYVIVNPKREQRLEDIRRSIPTSYAGPWTVHPDTTDDQWRISYATKNPLAGLVATVPDYGENLAHFIAETRVDVPWLMAELAEQDARAERRRLRMVAAEADLQTMRGHLSPNGQRRRVPMPLGKELAPVVEWLLAENERLTAELAEFEKSVPADDGEPVIA